MNDIINRVLDLAPIEEPTGIVETTDSEQADDDIELVRASLMEVANKSAEAIEELINIAKQTQHPRAYEVLNTVMKTFADVNMSLLDLQLKKQKIKGAVPGKGAPETQGVTNNNVFVGSTTELQQLIEDMHKKKLESDG